ncbi:MAG TPA: hypothetical protein VFE88_03830 [Candidatus Nanoarchaeia archaeon]|nr:hypothetical protein [Candidatus Nanoarchaeia archaeon]
MMMVIRELPYNPPEGETSALTGPVTHKFSISGHQGYFTVSYEQGIPTELSITMSREGSQISGLLDAISSTATLALQHQVPLEKIIGLWKDTRFPPSGFTGNPEIPKATSILDYCACYLEKTYLEPAKKQTDTLETPTP